MKAGKKNVKTGEPMYKTADHMKEAKVDKVKSPIYSLSKNTSKKRKKIW